MFRRFSHVAVDERAQLRAYLRDLRTPVGCSCLFLRQQ
jgi:hypothetical protein